MSIYFNSHVGSKNVDNILGGLLLNGMLLGAAISTFLDIVIPGK